MSVFRRRRLLRRLFQALEKVAGNIGLIREAGKEMRLFSHEASVADRGSIGRSHRHPPAPPGCQGTPALSWLNGHLLYNEHIVVTRVCSVDRTFRMYALVQ